VENAADRHAYYIDVQSAKTRDHKFPVGTVVTIDCIWEAGWLTVVENRTGLTFPVSYEEVEPNVWVNLYMKHTKALINCPNCEGGVRYDRDEIGRTTEDGCYTCQGNGKLTREAYDVIRYREMLDTIAGKVVDKMIQGANSDPEGEGWAFHAAENGLHPHEYTQHRVMDESGKLDNLFHSLKTGTLGSWKHWWTSSSPSTPASTSPARLTTR
jgi:hypothetical protein